MYLLEEPALTVDRDWVVKWAAVGGVRGLQCALAVHNYLVCAAQSYSVPLQHFFPLQLLCRGSPCLPCSCFHFETDLLGFTYHIMPSVYNEVLISYKYVHKAV